MWNSSMTGGSQRPSARVLLRNVNRGSHQMSDILMDGGVTRAYWYGDLSEVRAQSRA